MLNALMLLPQIYQSQLTAKGAEGRRLSVRIFSIHYLQCCWFCRRLYKWGRRCDPPPRSHPEEDLYQSLDHWTRVWTQSWWLALPCLICDVLQSLEMKFHGSHISLCSHSESTYILKKKILESYTKYFLSL